MLITTISLFERKITSALTELSPSVSIMYDNLKDEPPGGAANYLNLFKPLNLGL